MDLLTGNASHGFITFGVFRYIVSHKALDPVAVFGQRYRNGGID